MREGVFWRLTSVLLVLLAANEPLDLQTLLTSLARAHAKANGWYGEHRQAQYIFVVALGWAALPSGVAMIWATRRMNAAVRIALRGLAFIGAFILGRGAWVLNWGSLQELAGILVIAVAAAIYIRRKAAIP